MDQRKSKKKRHLIVSHWKPGHSNGQARPDWQTWCGEAFWPDWEGTTNADDVTCKRCLASLKRYWEGRLDAGNKT